MHGDLLANGFCAGLVAAIDADQHADLAHAGRSGGVDVGRDRVGLNSRHAANGHVLADGGDLGGDIVVDRFALHVSCFQRVDVSGARGDLSDLGHHRLEVGVARDEVGFRVHFNRNANAVGGGDSDEAFSGGAAGFLGGFRQTFGAQPVNSGFHVAVGFCQRLLGVHHACAGRVAQLFHLFRGDRHEISPWFCPHFGLGTACRPEGNPCKATASIL